MSGYTVGPWFRDGRTVYALNSQNFNRFSFSVQDAHTPESELIATATLAQSAPELLEALEELVRINEQHNAAIQSVTGKPAGWKDDYLNQARAAIAKARGEA